jgi:hypothetical protein
LAVNKGNQVDAEQVKGKEKVERGEQKKQVTDSTRVSCTSSDQTNDKIASQKSLPKAPNRHKKKKAKLEAN